MRTDAQILHQTNELARLIYAARGCIARPGYQFHLAQHPAEVESWQAACEAQKMLTDTDPEDALSNLDAESTTESKTPDSMTPQDAIHILSAGCGSCSFEQGLLTFESGRSIAVAEIIQAAQPAQTDDSSGSLTFSVDGGITWNQAPDGVRVIHKTTDANDDKVEIQINPTHEGVITDIWHVNDESGPIATEASQYDDIVARLVGDSPAQSLKG